MKIDIQTQNMKIIYNSMEIYELKCLIRQCKHNFYNSVHYIYRYIYVCTQELVCLKLFCHIFACLINYSLLKSVDCNDGVSYCVRWKRAIIGYLSKKCLSMPNRLQEFRFDKIKTKKKTKNKILHFQNATPKEQLHAHERSVSKRFVHIKREKNVIQ